MDQAIARMFAAYSSGDLDGFVAGCIAGLDTTGQAVDFAVHRRIPEEWYGIAIAT